ncbi:phage terminase small subunit [Sporolactobacillus terrae]|uniref:phage terminase small subunit n=1 Tax=Sporolactobacillus terrae TaxID=269673 RepID=UPI00048E76E6|nr:phage terminase small subunit [Sporolactobacillus terrae]
MPRKRDPRRDEAFEMWKEHKGEITNREIAKQLNVPEKTISAWKSKDNWNGVLHKKERSTPKQRGAPRGNKNAIGNEGGAPEHNQNARTHGLFAKWMPEETQEIIDLMETQSASDIIWQNIEIQYAAIIRAQQIMWVNSNDSHLKEQSGSSSGDDGWSKTYKVAFAYEQYDSFLKAQSRAMGELRALIRQFIEITDAFDERLEKLKLMKARINGIESEIKRKDAEPDKPDIQPYLEALKGKISEVWGDGDEE